MIIVGLTGGIGSGKSTISKYLKKKKIPVFDSDKEVNKIYKNKDKQLLKLVQKFDKNNKIVNKKKHINKKKLGDLVFVDRKKLKLLEKLIFKKLDNSRKKFLQKNKKFRKKIVILDAPLLFERRVNKICNYVILTCAPPKIRMGRLLKERSINKKKIKKIISIQMPEKKKQKLSNFIIHTSKGKWYSFKKVDKIIKQITTRANK